MTKEYLMHKIETSRNAIAFASPNADMTYAMAILSAAQEKLLRIYGETA